jgi:bacteriorhodopsin
MSDDPVRQRRRSAWLILAASACLIVFGVAQAFRSNPLWWILVAVGALNAVIAVAYLARSHP